MDYSAITAAVSYTSVIAGISAVSVLIAGLYLARNGAGTILNFLKRGK